MKAKGTIRKRQNEAGIALLISIFILLLISVVAIALIVSSGTESALAGNYRSSTGVYYAALAGLEEGRGRLLAKNPSALKNVSPAILPPPGTPLAVGSPIYIINPVAGETVAPWDLSTSTTYPDHEFNIEFPSSPMPNPAPNTTSVSTVAGIQGPLYKWVRINAVSEKSLNLDVYPYDGILNPTTRVFYDGTRLNIQDSGAQVLEITALAVLPNGSRKILQYLVAPAPLNLSFPAAVTLDGNSVQFTGTGQSSFYVDGNDQYPLGSCAPGSTPFYAIGYTNGADSSTILAAATPANHYMGAGGNSTTASQNVVSLPSNLLTVGGLNLLVQTIKDNADVPVINGPVTLSDSNNIMPAAMTSTNPMTVIVNGDLTINSWHNHGYGLLLVTGKLTYDPDAFWHGIILVIGKGWLYSNQSGGGQIQGAVFLAKTVDLSNNPLPPSSPSVSPFFNFTSSSGSTGVYYSSCWIQKSQPTSGYKILSFHEISQ